MRLAGMLWAVGSVCLSVGLYCLSDDSQSSAFGKGFVGVGGLLGFSVQCVCHGMKMRGAEESVKFMCGWATVFLCQLGSKLRGPKLCVWVVWLCPPPGRKEKKSRFGKEGLGYKSKIWAGYQGEMSPK